jgi:surfeit locus 1 family protein
MHPPMQKKGNILRRAELIYKIKIRTGFSLLCGSLFILCCALGVWQVERYHYKKELASSYESRLHSNSIPFSSSNKQKDEFQRFNITGEYHPTFTIFSSRFYQDQPGYEVFTAFKPKDDARYLLVDRGWVKKIPNITQIIGNQAIEGYIKSLNEYVFILGNNILSSSPLIMQKINITEIESITHQLFYPFVLRLDPKSAHGFVRDWIIVSVPPERHLAYAIQWFLFALIILIGYIYASFEKMDPEHAAS